MHCVFPLIKGKENHGNRDSQAPRGIRREEVCEYVLYVCTRMCVCVRAFSCSVVSQCWVIAGLARQIETGRWGGHLEGQLGAFTEHALKKSRTALSCCDRTQPGTLVTHYFLLPSLLSVIDARVTKCARCKNANLLCVVISAFFGTWTGTEMLAPPPHTHNSYACTRSYFIYLE